MPERPTPTAADERPDPTRAERLAALRRLDAICQRILERNPAALALALAAEAPTPSDDATTEGQHGR